MTYVPTINVDGQLHVKRRLNKVKCWMTEEELKEEEALLNEEEILWELDGIGKCWIEKSILIIFFVCVLLFRVDSILFDQFGNFSGCILQINRGVSSEVDIPGDQ